MKKIVKRSDVKLMTMTSMAALLTGCFDLDGPHYEYRGTDGDDVIVGESGGEYTAFYSSPGADTFTAVGNTHIFYIESDAGVKVYLDGTPGEGGHAEGDVLINFNYITGSKFDDTITARNGENADIRGAEGNDTLIGADANDQLYGDAGNDKLYGNAGADRLYGDIGNDELYGGAGDDYLSGGVGADKLDGGDGYDAVMYSNSEAAVTINLDANTNSGGDAQGDILISIEGIFGSEHDDHLTGDGGHNFIQGNDGEDQIYGLGGNDTLYGVSGNDKIFGGDGHDIIYGGSGYDELHGGNGNDLFYGYRKVAEDVNEINGDAGVDVLLVAKFETHYDYDLHMDIETDYDISYSILKSDNKILFNHADDTYVLNSVEMVKLLDLGNDLELETKDIQTIWTDLAVVEQAKFTGEAEFLSWLGNDAGYNYEGL